MYGTKLKSIRELRGFSQEYVAEKLGIAQNAYSRIENNQTKLSAELLEKVAKELGVSPIDILSSEPTVINFYGTAQGNFGTIETFNACQKELYEKLIASKDEEIVHLKRIIDTLLPKNS